MHTDFLIVFLGGGVGSVCRYAVNVLSARWFGVGFPYGTLTVNLFGALLIGMVAEYTLSKAGMSPQLKLLLMTGLLGGFTTFSAFSLEVVKLFQEGHLAAASGYVLVSIAGGIGAVFLGIWAVRHSGVVS